jgi:hypothetical protein
MNLNSLIFLTFFMFKLFSHLNICCMENSISHFFAALGGAYEEK